MNSEPVAHARGVAQPARGELITNPLTGKPAGRIVGEPTQSDEPDTWRVLMEPHGARGERFACIVHARPADDGGGWELHGA